MTDVQALIEELRRATFACETFDGDGAYCRTCSRLRTEHVVRRAADTLSALLSRLKEWEEHYALAERWGWRPDVAQVAYMKLQTERDALLSRVERLERVSEQMENLVTEIKQVLQPEFEVARADVLESGNQSLHAMIRLAVLAIREQSVTLLSRVEGLEAARAQDQQLLFHVEAQLEASAKAQQRSAAPYVEPRCRCGCIQSVHGGRCGMCECKGFEAADIQAQLEALTQEKAAASHSLSLVAMLLSHLYRVYDAGGISCGRSWESRLVEPALRLMDPYRPKSDIVEWPDREQTVREANDLVNQPSPVSPGRSWELNDDAHGG